MRTYTTTDLPPLSGDEQLWLYNGLDVSITRECFDVMAESHPGGFAYDMPRAMQGPALTMMRRGVRVDLFARDEETKQLDADLARYEYLFNRITTEGWGTPTNWQSQPQLMRLFYDVMRIEPVLVYDKLRRERRPAVNIEALEKLHNDPRAQHLVDLIMEMRRVKRLRNVLNTGLDPDGRLRCSYQVAGTMTGRWSSNDSAFHTGCVPADAEVLTPTGWKAISTIQSGDLVMQWDKGIMSFAPAEPFETYYNGKLYHCITEQVRQTLTADHRVPFFDSRKNFTEAAARTVAQRAVTYLPLAGNFVGGNTRYPRLLAALMANGSKESSGWRIAFKKQRKIERFLSLITECGIPYTEQKAKVGYRRFYIPGFLDWPKTWGAWVLDMHPQSLADLVDESKHWDGHIQGNSFLFFSADKVQVDWFCIAAHCCGYSTTWRHALPSEQSFAPNASGCYTVNVKPRNFAAVQRKHWTTEDYTGKVYCVSVPSTYFLVRFNGTHISVTGNTNLQNITDRARRIVIPDPGNVFVQMDLAQAESRMVAAISGDPAYREACASGDLHTTVCRMVWPDIGWPSNPADWKDFAENTKYYRHFSYRDMAKRAGHASNYGGSPHVLAMHLKIEVKVAQAFQDAYFKAFPGIRKWHARVAAQLARNNTITTALGRRCHFYARPGDNTALKSAIAYEPQSLIGDVLNMGLYNVWQRFDLPGYLELLLQVHDAICWQAPKSYVADLIPQVLEAMQVTIDVNGYPVTIPADASWGWNWGKAKFDPKTNTWTNPAGQRSFKPGVALHEPA